MTVADMRGINRWGHAGEELFGLIEESMRLFPEQHQIRVGASQQLRVREMFDEVPPVTRHFTELRVHDECRDMDDGQQGRDVRATDHR
jgi:hypothetical protein